MKHLWRHVPSLPLQTVHRTSRWGGVVSMLSCWIWSGNNQVSKSPNSRKFQGRSSASDGITSCCITGRLSSGLGGLSSELNFEPVHVESATPRKTLVNNVGHKCGVTEIWAIPCQIEHRRTWPSPILMKYGISIVSHDRTMCANFYTRMTFEVDLEVIKVHNFSRVLQHSTACSFCCNAFRRPKWQAKQY